MRRNYGGAKSSGSGFLDSMNDELLDLEETTEEPLEDEEVELPDEEGGLPAIEEELLSPGEYPELVLKEASIDEPIRGMERRYDHREEQWDYETAGAHGQEEAIATRLASEGRVSLEADSPYDFGDYSEDESDLFELGNGEDSSEATHGSPSTVDEADVNPDTAFDEVEDQDEDFDDIENILAGIERGDDGEEEDEESGASGNREKLESSFRITEEDEEAMNGFEIDEIISYAIERGASDIHIRAGEHIGFRINGSIYRESRFDSIPAEVTRRIQQKIVTNVAEKIFLETWELDTSYTVKSGKFRGRRVRASITSGFEEVNIVMRIISNSIPSVESLEVEEELLEWASRPDGLILMNGPTGTGKSTTLASIIQHVQSTMNGIIITVEKPVEYTYDEKPGTIVYQREVGRDTLSFASALDSAMRMDPDVILIGEARNSVEMDALLYAADTGHLSFSTTHANSAADTVNRIKRMFAGDERRQAMESLSSVAVGFAAQKLCKTVDGKGRFAVREILSVDATISELIMQGDSRAIRKIQEEKGTTLDHALVKAVRQGRCTLEEARKKSSKPTYFDALIADAPRFF